MAEKAIEFNIQQADRRLPANNYRALHDAQQRLHRLGVSDLPPIPANVAIGPGFSFKP